MHVDVDAHDISEDDVRARSTWELLAFLAWLPFVASGMWPVTAVYIHNAELSAASTWYTSLDFNWSLSGWAALAIPILALAGVLTAHRARSNIYHYDRRGKGIATIALIGSYVLLVGSPVWIPFFFFMTVGFFGRCSRSHAPPARGGQLCCQRRGWTATSRWSSP
jgi:hypothetical protein